MTVHRPGRSRALFRPGGVGPRLACAAGTSPPPRRRWACLAGTQNRAGIGTADPVSSRQFPPGVPAGGGVARRGGLRRRNEVEARWRSAATGPRSLRSGTNRIPWRIRDAPPATRIIVTIFPWNRVHCPPRGRVTDGDHDLGRARVDPRLRAGVSPLRRRHDLPRGARSRRAAADRRRHRHPPRRRPARRPAGAAHPPALHPRALGPRPRVPLFPAAVHPGGAHRDLRLPRGAGLGARDARAGDEPAVVSRSTWAMSPPNSFSTNPAAGISRPAVSP